VLSTYGYVEQPTDVIRASSEVIEDKIINIIRAVYRESRMTSKKVIAALPSFSVFSSIISLPAMGKKDLAQAIQWEAKKFIPLPLEEMRLDWKIIPEQKPVKKIVEKIFLPMAANGKKVANSEGLSPKEDSLTKEPSEEKKSFGGRLPFLAKILDRGKDNRGFGKKDILGKNNLKILLTAAPKSLVEKYRAKTFEVLSSKYEFKNGSGKIKKSLDFLALFYISNIYRDIRAKAKSILLQSKHKELYSIYTQLNPKYDLYAPWYLADLGQTLRYLILNRDFEGIFKEDSSINKNLLEQSYDILRKTVEGIGDINPIGLSKQIIKN